jgi:hypothetical protein
MLMKRIRTATDVRAYAGYVGAILGVTLALVYILVVTAFVILELNPADPVGGFAILSVCFVTVGGCYSFLPASVLGLITGGIIGEIHWRWRKQMTPLGAVLIGASAAISISVPFQLAYWLLLAGRAEAPIGVAYLDSPFGSFLAYLFWLGVPTVVYAIAAGVYSRWLYTRQSAVRQ